MCSNWNPPVGFGTQMPVATIEPPLKRNRKLSWGHDQPLYNLEDPAVEPAPRVEPVFRVNFVSAAIAPAIAFAQAPAIAFAQAPAIAFAQAPAIAFAQAPAIAFAQAPAIAFAQAPAIALAPAPAPRTTRTNLFNAERRFEIHAPPPLVRKSRWVAEVDEAPPVPMAPMPHVFTTPPRQIRNMTYSAPALNLTP